MRKENRQSHNYKMEGHREKSLWRILAGMLAVIVTFVTTYSLILPAITVSVEQVEEVGGLYLEEDDAEYEIVEDIDEQYELIPQGTDTPLAGYGTEGTLDGEFIEDDDQLAETESEMEAAGIELWNETEEETETETETEIESESNTETAAETETGADVETGVDVETEVDVETGVDVETEAETETETETETELKTEVESETEVETEEETDAETESTIGNKTRSAIDNSILASDGKNYKITVTYGAEAMIPEGAELQVEEILPGKNSDPGINGNRDNAHSTHNREYEEYVSRAQDAFNDGEKVTYARFFDITIVKDGTEIQPSGDVDVRIELTDELSEDIKAVHFGDEVEVLDTARVDAEILNDAVEFTASGFSVYGIVGTVIEKNVLASDGHNYKVKVTYGAETGIPTDAELAVEEILPDENDDASTSSAYDEYVSKTENALGMEEGSAGYIRLFDIKIVDEDDHSVKYQPKEGTAVDVRIELEDAGDGEDLSVVHFADGAEEGDKVDAETDGQVVSFEADGFSVYAIVDGDQSTGETYSIKYTFVLEDGTPYNFTNKNGDTTNIQYVKDGEIPYNPGTPTASTGEQADKEFAGWWTKNGTAWDTELSFDTPVSTSSMQEITVYARYDNTQYITYYDENGTVYLVDRRHENDTVLTTDIKNSATGEKWTEQELEDYRFVAYQPLSKTTAFLGWTATQGENTPDANFTISEATTLYPVIAEVKWVTYHSGPTGSNATYFGAEYALDGNWERTNLADHIPTRAGYQFDGWYIRNTVTQGDDDNLDYSWTVSSSDVRVTDANGNFDNNFKNNSTYFENGKLKNDIELVAHWTPTTVNYVFVYYQQEPNANDDGTYDYVYKDSRTASGLSGSNTGTPPVPDWNDIAGFSLHNTDDSNDPYNVKTQVIEGDGSTVVNVYYDRNTYTVTFFERRTGSGYVLNNNATNNVYGYSNGEYVPLTRESHNETTWILSRYYYSSTPTPYTGTIYDRNGNVVNNPTYGNTYYNFCIRLFNVHRKSKLFSKDFLYS